MNDAIRMQISAYVDGELPENEAELLLRRMTQDVELRREAAEFLAMRRLIRGEAGLAATDKLHERVSAELDERPSTAAVVDGATVASKFVRPLLGVAIAASVALVAIFSLQTADVAVEEPGASTTLVDTTAVPERQPQQEQQRQYFLNHAEASSELGANGINSRLVTLRFSEEVAEDDAEDASDEEDSAADDSAEQQSP